MIPRLPILPHRRHARTARRSSLDIEMHPTITRILEIIARTAAPLTTSTIAGINDLHDDARAGADAAIVGVKAAGGELVAATTC